ncbi:MAG: alpha/beta hydrolase [Synergistaceae bacterium]|nr:alpha/beta hydrolase [Synergistaceae bacterium]
MELRSLNYGRFTDIYSIGTRDPFVREFEEYVAALKETGVTVKSYSLEGWPHGFGAADCEWIKEFDRWLSPILGNN